MSDRAWDEPSSAFFENMVESVGVGVAIYDVEGIYRYVNPAYAELFGTDRSSLAGIAIWDVVPEMERERFDGYWNSFDDGETRQTETVHEFDGVSVEVNTITTRHTIDGTPYHFGTIQDISERKANQRELRRQNERLESFVGIVSHDLRNPLSVANGYLELLQDDIDRDELDLIESSLTRMELLIDDLLTLAKEGRSVDEVQPVSLEDVAAAAWRNVETPRATLHVEENPSVYAARTRLQQLFENLFRNSVEHGSDDVTITVGIFDDGFYIEDDGSGIPEAERDRVFETGYSTDPAGTGFGLNIVEQITEAHGWEVSVTEGADGGARFEFIGIEFDS